MAAAVAVSGGQTPWQMLRLLASEDVPWEGVHVLQVDERVAMQVEARCWCGARATPFQAASASSRCRM